MHITKRDGSLEQFNAAKIERAIALAFKSVDDKDHTQEIKGIVQGLSSQLAAKDGVSVEEIQDLVEEALMRAGYYQTAKNYIKYRAQRGKKREVTGKFAAHIANGDILETITSIVKDFKAEEYSAELLYQKFLSFLSEDLSEADKEARLVKAAVELTTTSAPLWEYIAARLLCQSVESSVNNNWAKIGAKTYYERLVYLVDKGYAGKYLLENYSKEDIEELEQKLDFERNKLFTYGAIDLLYKRYLIRSSDGAVLETPQEMFMSTAMHLAMTEGKNKKTWALKIYDITSKLQVTLATPTMSNARKPFHQLSSCFIDTVPDSLEGIYRSIDNFAQVSKFGGGMGLYFGKVRATGSAIRGFKGAAGGVIRWIKLANDTAVAVDQLGVRQGSVAVYLDAWHKDLPEFLQIRTNNGDDRLKAHDVFPAVCYPDYFWHLVDTDLESDWHLMCPHEIKTIKGYSLEDCFGEEWKAKYFDCINDKRIDKRVIKIKDIIRLIIKSVTETGTPFTFNRDIVNALNPNGHKGVVYSSNLCTEIAQNMSAGESLPTQIKTADGDSIIVKQVKAGDFVVCNLASLVLGNIDVSDKQALEDIINTAVRTLDNVIDLNFYPVPYAAVTNKKYRAIGLGVSGYHHMLIKNGIKWESEAHLEFADKVMEDINYFTIAASSKLALEKGSYEYFEGSDWQTGAYYTKRDYNSERWQNLAKQTAKGMRNAYLLAVAPTSSTSIIAGTSPGTDPVMNKFFLEEKRGSIIPRVAPGLNAENFWLYKSAHTIEQSWVVKAAGIRQRHIDQSQSVNFYITTDFTIRQVLGLFVEAWKNKVKTVYYVRSKSLETEECESCAN